MNKLVDAFAGRRADAQRDVLVPPFPADIIHYDDGTWECSAESFDRMHRSFKRFGLELDYEWSFEVLYARFSFVLRSSSLVASLGLGWVEERHPPEMVDYLRAVAARDDVSIAQFLPAALRLEANRLPPNAMVAVMPAAEAVATEANTPRRAHLHLVRA